MEAVAAPILGNEPRETTLTRHREHMLLKRYGGGDMSVRNELIRHFMPLASSLARRYRRSGEPAEDLDQVAYVGLMKAIDRYDPDLGSFVPFAVPNVLGELKRHFRDHGWSLHVPRPVQKRFLEVVNASDKLQSSLGRPPTTKDIADHTGYSLEQVVEALDAGGAYTLLALDAPISTDSDGDATLGDQLGDEDERFARIDRGSVIAPAFKALPKRDRRILYLRFMEDLNQTEIAERVGISQMHVSRLIRRALNRLSAVAAV